MIVASAGVSMVQCATAFDGGDDVVDMIRAFIGNRVAHQGLLLCSAVLQGIDEGQGLVFNYENLGYLLFNLTDADAIFSKKVLCLSTECDQGDVT